MTALNAPWHIRHEFDDAIYRNVYVNNEYGVPDDMTGWTVLDVGGHIGCFSRLCVERGARVLAVEPDSENASWWRKNIGEVTDGSSNILEFAVASEYSGRNLYAWCGDPACYTTSRGGMYIRCLQAAPLEHFLSFCRQWNTERIIDLCKIDCEGAEYEIVESSVFLGVKRLAIEFHDFTIGGDSMVRQRAEWCRKRLAELKFTEQKWEKIHTEDPYWYVLYCGEREWLQ